MSSQFCSLGDALNGSPYSLDLSALQLYESVEKKFGKYSSQAAALRETYRVPEMQGLRRTHRIREVFESNAIEGLGLPLRQTEVIMQENQTKSPADLMRYSISMGIAGDKHAYDVMGLQGARELADIVAEDGDRALAETDLRNMHSLIVGDVPYAGRYKRYANTISGATHEPTLPIDVPDQMRELAQWLSRSDVHPICQATVGHAWLTHIHPFEDGNGRMARLLANLVLARAGYPPAIIKSSADRAGYIDALAASDAGGNVLPLLTVFNGALRRTFFEVEHPEHAMRTWRRQTQSRQPIAFLRWREEVEYFLRDFGGQLNGGLQFVPTPLPDAESYEHLLLQLASSPSPRIGRVVVADDPEFDLLVIAAPPSQEAQRNAAVHPSIRFLFKTHDLRDTKTHRALNARAGFEYGEVCVRPEEFQSAVLIGIEKPRPCGIGLAARVMAEQVANFAANYHLIGIGERFFADRDLDPSMNDGSTKPRRERPSLTRFR